MIATRRKIVLLLSGGLDSATAGLLLRRDGAIIVPLFVAYGQRAEAAERRAALELCRRLEFEPLEQVEFPALGTVTRSILTDVASPMPLDPRRSALREYLPYRNLLLATLGGAMAVRHGACGVALGLIDDGPESYLDSRAAFVELAGAVLSYEHPIELLAPLVRWDKSKVWSWACEHGLDPAWTWSCNLSSDQPCGRCSSCAGRERASREGSQ